MKNEVHIVHTDDKWKVKKNNTQKSSGNFNTKEKAVDYGKKLSIKNNAELVVHNKDGKISYKNSYGNDPCPPRDKK